MKQTRCFLIFLFFALMFSAASCGKADVANEEKTETNNTSGTDENGNDNKTSGTTSGHYLVVYFSRSGNTRTVAQQVRQLVGDSLLAIEPTTAYTSDYDKMLTVAQQEINNIDGKNLYPSIKTTGENFDKYDAIFICTPLWWSRMSTPMQAFLNNHSDKLKGKKLYLAVTSSSSGISSVVADAKRWCAKSALSDTTLWIKASDLSNVTKLVTDWITALKVSRKQ